MIDSFITSKTRVKLMLKFFTNPRTRAYLRELAEEFGESTNAVRVELNRMSEAGLLESQNEGRTKLYQANTKHPLFPELRSIALKTLKLDSLVDDIVQRLGNVELAFVTGDYAKGIDSGLVDLMLVGDIDEGYLKNLVEKVETMTKRKIRYLVLSRDEYRRLKKRFEQDKVLVLWKGNTGKNTKEHRTDA
jgi:DNA-binding TFAR19-related protein (PDSD5 family)